MLNADQAKEKARAYWEHTHGNHEIFNLIRDAASFGLCEVNTNISTTTNYSLISFLRHLGYEVYSSPQAKIRVAW